MKLVLGFFVCIFSLMFIFSSGVRAEDYDWVKGAPTVRYQKETAFQWTPYCPTYYQNEEIKGTAGRVPVCQFGGEHLRVGISLPDNGSIRLVVASSLETVFHAVQGVCTGIRNCVYSPQTDTLVARYYTPFNFLSVQLFRNVTERIKLVFNPTTGMMEYIFDGSHPDFSFANEDGSPLAVEAVAISPNGKWVLIEYRSYGIILVNQETLEMRRILAQGFRYGWAVDPTVEMAVSNDGKTVAVMGERTGFTLARVTPECGDRVRPGMGELFQDTVVRCPLVSVDVASMIPQFHGAYDPQFDEGGGRLDFIVMSQTGGAKRVGVRALSDTPTPTLEYLAVGDSFTSGEGETDSRYYMPGTDQEFEKCHLSRRSYPFLFARLVEFSLVQSVACSGAKMGDVFHAALYWGQGGRLGAQGLHLSEEEVLVQQATALDSFHPGVIPQSQFIERYEPALVTVGIGGNDAGITTKLKVCAMPGECEWTSEAGRQKTAGEIQSLFGRFVEFYQRLSNLSPLSRLIIVGYPLAVDTLGVCDPITRTLLSASERRYMNESIDYLNKVIERAARFVGLGFADMRQVFAGHQLCSGSLDSAMNGFRVGDDASIGSMGLRLIGNESFHPTPYGHELIAQELSRKYHLLTEPNDCTDCGVAPEAAHEYWGEPGDETKMRLGEFALPRELNPVQRTISISLAKMSLLPGSEVRVEIHSDPVVLGGIRVDSEGGLNDSVLAPETLSEGFHTIHLFGVLPSGEDVELYQEIFYGQTPELSKASLSLLPVGEANENNEAVSLSEVGSGSMNTSLSSAGVLGATTTRLSMPEPRWFWPVIGVIIVIILGMALARYNGCMANIRKIVKRLIPTRVFKAIEPTGHLAESVLMNIRYGFPGRKMRIIGVTGTNGKTTTSFMIYRLLHESGKKVALLTTVANGVGADITPQKEHMTTTKASILLSRLRRYAEAGAEWAVVETSSHALAQHRVWGLPYEVAVMTNITHEHLDYHGTFTKYVEAKRQLFKIANKHGLRFGVVNAQDPSAKKFVKTVANSTTYGIGTGELSAENVVLETDHSTYTARIDGDSYDIRVNIPGEFNVSNSLAAIAVGRKLGLTKKQIEKGIAALKGVEGRMNIIDEGQKFKVMVDFASTPDGFEKFFASVRPLTKGKLIAVFGSAGRRDESKRPLQGQIAGKAADVVILTEEDDRDIDGNQILQEIAAGARKAGKKEGKDLFLILNREEAIGFAMTQASSPDDVVVLLGKGHELTIERADGTYPWNEAEVARAALQAMKKNR